MFAHTNSLTSIYSKKVQDSWRKFNRMRQTLLVITVSNEPTIKTKYVSGDLIKKRKFSHINEEFSTIIIRHFIKN